MQIAGAKYWMVFVLQRKNEQIYFEPLNEMFDRVEAKRGRESKRTFRSRASRELHTQFYGNPVTDAIRKRSGY